MIIRQMNSKDKDEVFEMMRVFYDSPAVLHETSDEVLKKDIDDCVGEMPFIEGYIFEENGIISGYTMVAKNYSTEYGGLCLWIEDIYIKPEFQKRGYCGKFFEFLEEKYKGVAVRSRLEAEKSNVNALSAYKKYGFEELEYVEFSKDLSKNV